MPPVWCLMIRSWTTRVVVRVTIRDDIVELLRGHPAGLSDAEIANRLGKLHQQVNQRCRQMASEGVLVRDSASGVIINRILPAPSEVIVPSGNEPTPSGAPAAASTWPHESAVQAALVSWLAREHWQILRVADTETRERGVDVIAKQRDTRLEVEVKGYPATTYLRGAKAGEPKPTNPGLQASHWLANAILKAMRLRGGDANTRVAIALPDMPRYESLLHEIDKSLQGARIEAWLISEDGQPRSRFGATPQN